MSSPQPKTVTLYGLVQLLRLFNINISTNDELVDRNGLLLCPTSDIQLVDAISWALFVLGGDSQIGQHLADGNFCPRWRQPDTNQASGPVSGPSNPGPATSANKLDFGEDNEGEDGKGEYDKGEDGDDEYDKGDDGNDEYDKGDDGNDDEEAKDDDDEDYWSISRQIDLLGMTYEEYREA
ncbi:hypothetical protein FA13DRAFT_1718653 [Coprinellus micaceus]|uniref:Uncharacterized protein n=1 Tax=Coprinellus micaceus TaxID=71717 RepID=A0A4Y7SCW9_COPMI|nr:hypothetical protein FA13DRAFT_1718653 [Coprinellus micaceus]